MSESEIEKEIDRLLQVLSGVYSTPDIASVIGSLVNYLSFRAQKELAAEQKEVTNQTKESIKWSRRLVYTTGALAAGTFLLAIVTYFR